MPRISLAAIAFDAGTQVRASIDEATVSAYAERMTEGDAFPPIVVFADGTCRPDTTPIYHLADGFHRTHAALRNQFRDIDADVRPGTKVDALWFALGANRTNGKQMNAADKKHAIVLALQTWPDRSGNQIAGQIGVNQSSVQRVKDEVMRTHNLPSRVTGKDGKSYPASRSTKVEASTAEPKKSKAAVAQRRKDLRDMAERGFSTRQIAAALEIHEATVGKIAQAEAIVIHADRIVGRTRRPDADRIVAQTVLDAENLTADVGLIEFSELDRSKLAEWIASLQVSRDRLNAFIRRLTKEQQHVEVA